MNWSRAKNLSIFLFVILNVALLFLNYLDRRQYVLSPVSIQAITTVLDRHHISLASDFTFVDHVPLRQVGFDPFHISQNFLANVLMIDHTNLSIETLETGETRFFNAYEEVVFLDGYARYRNLGNDSLQIHAYQDARLFAANVLSALGDVGRYFVLDRSFSWDNGFQLEYRQLYRNTIIYSNFISFTFLNDTLDTIRFDYQRVNGFIGNARELRSGDEVLLTFMRATHGEVHLLEMDLVYKNISLVGAPHYRILYRQENGHYYTLLINAFTNVVSHREGVRY